MKNLYKYTRIVAVFMGMAVPTASVFAELPVLPTQVSSNTLIQIEANSQGGNAYGKGNVEVKENNSEDKTQEKKTKVTAEHKNMVALFVQNLLKVADRSGGIGTEVRAIAQAQQEQEQETSEAITKVETRGKFRTFLFGTDYKSIGVIRSSLATYEKNLAQLQMLISKATNTVDKVALEAEMKALQEDQVKLQAFIEKHENTFSLLGWLFKN